ncbi:MAG: hypothetical protein LQ347_003996 [Umbilicaria vellea]|nr:MAG: hypothetical protein LQ347_003996 [Umbilicaria vellea]
MILGQKAQALFRSILDFHVQNLLKSLVLTSRELSHLFSLNLNSPVLKMSGGERQDTVPTFDDDTFNSLFEGEFCIPSPELTGPEPQQPKQASPTMSEYQEWTTGYVLPNVEPAIQQPTQVSPTLLQFQEWFEQYSSSNAQQASPISPLLDPQLDHFTQASPIVSELSMRYPSPDAPQRGPYPMAQKYQNGGFPAHPAQSLSYNSANYTQGSLSNVPPSMPTSHAYFNGMVDQSWLLYGQQRPPGQPEQPPKDGIDDSFPDDLALSSEDETETPRPAKVRKVRKGEKGVRRKETPRVHRANADRDPEKPWVVTNKNKGLNRRAAKITNYRPEEYYSALSRVPASWRDFKYTIDGELERGKLYSVAQIEQFLYEHPLHNTADGYDRKKSGLIVWIQKNPADSARRYPTSHSSRCRFAKCFAINNTINQGQYRVTFDEQSHQERNHDPHHNAGYVHLYCLEKHLDFPKLCANLNVRAENRNLYSELDGKNRMLMGSKAERITAEEFIDNCTTFGQPLDYPSHDLPNRPHEGTLTYHLSRVKLENEPSAQHRLRAERGQDKKGTALKNHLGNLEIETVERAKTRKAENQNWSRTGEPRKRKRSE